MKQKIVSIFSLFFLLAFVVGCSNNPHVDNPNGPDNPEPVEEPNNNIKVSYTESDEIITNPERGFYTHREFATGTNTTLTASQVRGFYESGLSLILNVYYMRDFRDKLISDEFLQRVENNLKALREGGCKTVLRFAYTSSENQHPRDAPWELTRQHIEQLKPLLEEYVDVICVLEAGFIGAWGEWYYTDNYIYQPADDEYGPRRQVLDALLAALPKERMICVRYPKAKLFTFDLEYTDTISIDRAYDQSDISRLAFHNDCFLADQDDRGTFGGNRNHRQYWRWETKYVAMGGETCYPSSFAECENALLQFENYHWSYINQDYHRQVIAMWNGGECIDEIKKRLGYRFVLTDGEFSETAEAGNPFEIKLNVKNVGWAAPFNPRDVEIIFISQSNQDEKYRFPLQNDPRFWFAGETNTIEASVTLPEAMPTGKYDVYLNLPDPKPTLRNRMEYSIQLANKDTWDAERGYNKIYTAEVD